MDNIPIIFAKLSPDLINEYAKDMIADTTDSHSIC